MIILPHNWNMFVNNIRDRCYDFIEHKFWNGISRTQFDQWRQNFKTDEEKYFSACILDSLIYRSNEQTFALIFQLLSSSLPNLFRKIRPNNIENDNFFHAITQVYDPNFRFVSTVKPCDSPTKSSYEILRFMKRKFHVKETWIINPDTIDVCISAGIKTFIFIDDFLGTGDQFNEVWDQWGFSQKMNDCIVVYAPLTAHVKGIGNIKQSKPFIEIVYSEILDSNHSFFANYFSDNGNNPDHAKQFYNEIFTKRGITISKEKLFGWGNLELTYGYEHAFPDNSLPILHWKENWYPLFNR